METYSYLAAYARQAGAKAWAAFQDGTIQDEDGNVVLRSGGDGDGARNARLFAAAANPQVVLRIICSLWDVLNDEERVAAEMCVFCDRRHDWSPAVTRWPSRKRGADEERGWWHEKPRLVKCRASAFRDARIRMVMAQIAGRARPRESSPAEMTAEELDAALVGAGFDPDKVERRAEKLKDELLGIEREKIRREQMEADCRVICRRCNLNVRVVVNENPSADYNLYQHRPVDGVLQSCDSSAIRAAYGRPEVE